MRKNLLIITLLFVGLFTFFVNNINPNKGELGVRDIYIANENYDVLYYVDKYDIYNENSSFIQMDEVFDSSKENLAKNSFKDEYKIECCAYVNKIEKYFTFSYVLYINNKIELTSSVKVDIIEYDNKYYFSSSNGYISPCSELYESSSMEKCAAIMYTSFDDTIGLGLLSDRFGLGGGGGGGGAFLGAALGAGAALGTAAALGALDQTISNSNQIQGVGGSSSSSVAGGSMPPNNNNNNNNSKKDKVRELSDEISEDYKQNFKCEEYADALENKMKVNGISGERIKVTPNTGYNYIYSNEFDTISYNGYHYGIKVDNYVFDNLHPQGVEYSKWLEDLGGDLYNTIKVIRSW